MKYRKIGQGNILKCYKDKITKLYISADLKCICNNQIGNDEGLYYKMNSKSFICNGFKER